MVHEPFRWPSLKLNAQRIDSLAVDLAAISLELRQVARELWMEKKSGTTERIAKVRISLTKPPAQAENKMKNYGKESQKNKVAIRAEPKNRSRRSWRYAKGGG